MVKIIASDMDGTILNDKMAISHTNAQAVLKAQQKGVLFLAATGRGYEQAAPLFEEAGITCPIIALNGAQLYDEKGNLVFSRGLDKAQVRDMLTMIADHGAHGEIMTTEGVYSDSRENRLKALAYMQMELNPKLSYEEAREYSEERMEELHISFVNDYEEILQRDDVAVLKLSAFHEDGPSALEPLQAFIESKYEDLAVTSSHHSNLEINHVSAQKGIALEEYASKLGVEADEVMAIGDNINDISMLKWARFSFAMENGREEAKQAAEYLASSNDENGVAEAIARVLQKQLDGQVAAGKSVDK